MRLLRCNDQRTESKAIQRYRPRKICSNNNSDRQRSNLPGKRSRVSRPAFERNSSNLAVLSDLKTVEDDNTGNYDDNMIKNLKLEARWNRNRLSDSKAKFLLYTKQKCNSPPADTITTTTTKNDNDGGSCADLPRIVTPTQQKSTKQ